ncbi:hypothetical protein FKM82_009563 [Ascaphus truei]
MYRPAASLGASISHQATAFTTLRLLLQDKGLRLESSDTWLIEETDQLQNTVLELNSKYSHHDGDIASSSVCGTAMELTPVHGEGSAPISEGIQTHSSNRISDNVLINRPAGRDKATSCSSRSATLAEVASRNRLSRVTHLTAQLLSVEQNMLHHLTLDHPFTIQLKDSIEFRNICTHMALQVEDRRFDQDLNEAQQCLGTIITNLIQALAVFSSGSCEAASAELKQILHNLCDGRETSVR